MTILELLNKLRWDNAYVIQDFRIGYWDRVVKEIIEVRLTGVDWEASDKFALSIEVPEVRWGEQITKQRTIPLHRIRKVWQGEELVWSRMGPEGKDS